MRGLGCAAPRLRGAAVADAGEPRLPPRAPPQQRPDAERRAGLSLIRYWARAPAGESVTRPPAPAGAGAGAGAGGRRSLGREGRAGEAPGSYEPGRRPRAPTLPAGGKRGKGGWREWNKMCALT